MGDDVSGALELGDAGSGRQTVLPPHPRAVRAAREFVRQCCSDAGIDLETRDTAELLTSELVTNAFIHGRSEARVTLTATAGRVLVRVGDHDPRTPDVVARQVSGGSGRGLAILVELADEWGVSTDDVGKNIWFTLNLDPDRRAAQPTP